MSPRYPHALSFDRYRELLAADFARMRAVTEAARDGEVPECEGWRGSDVAHHTAEVYLHKTESIRTGTMPAEGWPPARLAAMEPVEVLDECYGRLVEQFDAHDPSDPAATWWPPDQTVGFWVRRMAHETAVHRRDMESAAGQVTEVDADLSVDGIDEVLELFLSGDWEDEAVEDASGRTVAVESAGHEWVVTLGSRVVELARAGGTEAVARVSGDPSAVLLWLWGRGPQPATSGDADAVRELRERLALATR